MTVLPKLSIFNSLFKRDNTRRSLYVDRKEVMSQFNSVKRRSIDDSKLIDIIKPTPAIEKLLKTPHLIFFRQVATPLYETLEVIKLAKELELELCILGYKEDKLVSAHNKYKHGLCILPLYKGTDRNGDDMFQRKAIVDLNKYSGKHLKDVYTLKDERLLDFHHRLLEEITGLDVEQYTVDISDWLSQFEEGASQYYEAFFLLFIKHNVLAEVFLPDEFDGQKFNSRVIRPAFNKAIKNTGFSPLIVNYQPADEQDRIYWDCYPDRINDFLLKEGYIE